MLDLKALYSKINKKLDDKMKVDYFLSLDKFEFKKWSYYACIKAQIEGLTIGYKTKVNNSTLVIEDFYLLNSIGNIDDLKRYLKMQDYIFPNGDTQFFSKDNLNAVK